IRRRIGLALTWGAWAMGNQASRSANEPGINSSRTMALDLSASLPCGALDIAWVMMITSWPWPFGKRSAYGSSTDCHQVSDPVIGLGVAGKLPRLGPPVLRRTGQHLGKRPGIDLGRHGYRALAAG